MELLDISISGLYFLNIDVCTLCYYMAVESILDLCTKQSYHKIRKKNQKCVSHAKKVELHICLR